MMVLHLAQVLSKALEIWGLSCVSLDSPNMIAYNQNPVMAQAFMCNLRVGPSSSAVCSCTPRQPWSWLHGLVH